MTTIFHEIFHDILEDYVDDIVVKTKTADQRLAALTRVFERCREFNLKMNPMKSAFEVRTGKFLGFMVNNRGIEIDRDKITAIQEMPPPKTVKQVKSFLGKFSYIRPFIPNLAKKIYPLNQMLKKDAHFKWSTKAQKVFEALKQELTKSPTLMAPIAGKPLILYLLASNISVGVLLA